MNVLHVAILIKMVISIYIKKCVKKMILKTIYFYGYILNDFSLFEMI